jgi:hypothetical protein
LPLLLWNDGELPVGPQVFPENKPAPELPLPARELEDRAAGGGEDGVPFLRLLAHPWPRNNSAERYNSSESLLKKEIPAQADLVGAIDSP